MKKFKIIFLLITIITLLFLSKETSLTITKITTNFAIHIFPTLAPALLINNILIYSGGIYPLFINIKANAITKHKIYLFSLIFLGLVSGTPTLANMINNEIDKTISKEEGQNILNYFSFPSIPFLFALIINSTWPSMVAVLVVLIPILISIIFFGISMHKKYKPLTNIKINSEDKIINKAILATFKSLVLMLGSIILFSLFLVPLSIFMNEPYLYYIQGFLEFSYPLSYLFQNYTNINAIISMLIISFSSLSLILQIHLLAPKIDIQDVIKKRVLISGISLFVSFIFFI